MKKVKVLDSLKSFISVMGHIVTFLYGIVFAMPKVGCKDEG